MVTAAYSWIEIVVVVVVVVVAAGGVGYEIGWYVGWRHARRGKGLWE